MVRQGWLLFFVLLPLTILASTPNQQPTPYTPPEAWAKRLQDPNVNVRREAVVHLANHLRPQTMDWLLPMLEDSDSMVRDLTLLYFTAIEQSDEQKLLAMAAVEDPIQRRRAVLALGAMRVRRIGTHTAPQQHLPILYQALLDPDASVRKAAGSAFELLRDRSRNSEKSLPSYRQLRDEKLRGWSLITLGWPRETDLAAVLLKGIASPDPTTQRWSAWLLGWTNDRRAERPLIDLLQAPAPEARIGAAAGLGRFQQARVIEPLLGALRDADPQVRAQTAQSLAWLHEDAGPDVQEELAKRRVAQCLLPLMADPDLNTRIAIVRSLGTFADPATARPLIAALAAGDPLRFQLVEALGNIGHPEAVAILEKQLRDPDLLMSYVAIRALAKIDDPRATDVLLALLNDPSQNVRSITVYEIARGRVTNARLAPPLIEVALHGQARDDRDFAVEALGRFPGQATVQALITILQNTDNDLSRRAASSLAQLHDATVVDPLLKLLPDLQFPWTQANVIGVLGAMGNRKAVPAIIPCLGSQAPVLRSAAARALNQLTGENFGEDPARWQAWWEARKNE